MGDAHDRTKPAADPRSRPNSQDATGAGGFPEKSLRARAVSLLARRELSRDDLRRRLSSFAESPAELEFLLDRLQQEGLLSDRRFADLLVRSRGERFGVARVAQELRQHGITGEVQRAAVEELRQGELARARALWRRKFGQPAGDAAGRARQARFLSRRGFSADVVRRVISGLDEE